MAFHVRANEPTDADIAIVGAGPAGAVTACHFARAGFRVVVFDQRRFPRDKVCGDFVGPAALEEIDRLGLLSQPIFRNATKIHNGSLHVNGDKLALPSKIYGLILVPEAVLTCDKELFP